METCRQEKAWVDLGYSDLKMAVNLSPKQFLEEQLNQKIFSCLEQTGLKAANLEVEITESMLMEDIEHAIHMMERISQSGITIAMDDFGTGYSSLAYLKRFPLHTLKVDRTFVAQLTMDSDDAKIVSTIITMANGLGLKVVAEGVEMREQVEFLKGKGCDSLQGYYFSRPVSAEEAEALLKRDFTHLI